MRRLDQAPTTPTELRFIGTVLCCYTFKISVNYILKSQSLVPTLIQSYIHSYIALLSERKQLCNDY